MFRKFFRFALFATGVTVALWLTREHLLPAPHVPHEPPPRYRSTPPPPQHSATDDLTAIKGIGPVYANGLVSMGITTYHALAESDPRVVAEELGTSSARVQDWIAHAKTLHG